MTIEEKKRTIEVALTTSFVDSYEKHKSTLGIINKDLKKSKIKYQYSYDEFCADLLNITLQSLNDVDIFSYNSYDQLFSNVREFTADNLMVMLVRKIESLGYKLDGFFKNSKLMKDLAH
jgi:hypothetical protein